MTPSARASGVAVDAAVFGAGAGVMIVEMTAVRALEPYFGSTTWVWTNVIAVVLGALAAGYVFGGRLADRYASATLLFAVVAVGGVLIASASFVVRPVSELFLDRSLQLEGITSLLAKGSLGASLILFAPAAVFAGMIGPMAVRLGAGRGTGRAAGRVFALSTIGSILGTYLPATVLVRQVGSRGSMLVAAMLLLVTAAVGLTARRRWRLASIVLLLLASAVGALALDDRAVTRTMPSLDRNATSTVVQGVESEYQYLEVRTDRWPDGRVRDVLTINEGIRSYQSIRMRGSVLTGARYYDDYALLPLFLDRPPGSELRGCIVGLAGGVIALQWHHFWADLYDLSVEGAEIDAEVVSLARRHFGLPGPGSDWLRVRVMDGRQMLVALPEKQRFHLLVIDAFANQLYHPFHLATREFFELCRRRLEPGGILAINVSAVDANSPHLGAITNTLAVVFGSCLRVRQAPGRNFLLLSRKGERVPDVSRLNAMRVRRRFGERKGVAEWHALIDSAQRLPPLAALLPPRPDGWVLTDDHAPLEWLTDRTLEQLEREILR